MKKIAVIILILSGIVLPQRNRNNPTFKNRPIPYQVRMSFSELYTSLQDKNVAYFIYKVPINKLLFEKDGERYNAKLRVSLEVFNNETKEVFREFDEKNISFDDYKFTRLPFNFVQGLIALTNVKDIQKVIPTFTDVYSKREFKGKPLIVNKTKLSSKFLSPIVVHKKESECDGNEAYKLANYGGEYPYSENKYEILLPIKNLEVDELFVKIKHNGKILFNKTINDSFKGDLKFENCNNKIILKIEDVKEDYQFFMLNGIDELLPEGPFKIEVSTSSDFKDSFSFLKRIIWFDKPFSLRNSELAIKNLKYIEDNSIIDNLLDSDTYLYGKNLENYWKKYDPTPNTSYNPIMKEYYQRIDYSMQHFSPISRKSGANTDRGKIYIKYGKPNKVKRTSNTYGQVTEIWYYNKVKKEFVFIDKYGIGDFTLVTG